MGLHLLAILIVQLNFGILPVAQKVALRGLTPLGLFSVRNIFGALVFYLIYRIMSPPPSQNPVPVRTYLWLSLLGITLNQFLLILALTKTSAVALAVVVPAITLFTYGFAVLLKREVFELKKGLILLLGGVGVLVLFFDSIQHMIEYMDTSLMIGNLLSICSAACYAYYLVVARDYVTREPAIAFTCKKFCWALVWLIPTVVFTWLIDPERTASTLFLIPQGEVSLSVLCFIVLGPTVLNYFLNFWALSRLPSSTVSGFISLQTLIGSGLAHFVLGEDIRPGYVVAAACIVSSVVLLSIASVRKSRAQ